MQGGRPALDCIDLCTSRMVFEHVRNPKRLSRGLHQVLQLAGLQKKVSIFRQRFRGSRAGGEAVRVRRETKGRR